MVSLLMGLMGFGLGLLFGWLLHRERVARGESEGSGQNSRTTATLADTSARLERADQDLTNLRAQLTDAKHRLDERDATIAQLEAELAGYRDTVSDAATTELADAEPEAGEFEVDETDVTDELLAPTTAAFEGEVVAEEVVADEVVADETAPPAEPEPVVAAEHEPELEPEPVVAPEPEPVAEQEPSVEEAEPDAGQPDDLQRIRGLGPAMARSLDEQGIITFRQIADLDDAAIEKLEAQLPSISSRIRRNNWVEQARKLHVETHGDQ